jgi:hypothetical protein
MHPLSLQFGEALVHRFSQVLYRCFEEVGSTKVALYLLIPEVEGFHLVAHFGWPRISQPPELLATEDPLVNWARRERRSFAVNQASQISELACFAPGSESPRFLITPFYDRGEWVGLLIQKDRTKGLPYELERDAGPTQSICQEIVEALREFQAGRSAPPPLTNPPNTSSPMEVPVPPSGAMVLTDSEIAVPAGEFLEGFYAAFGESTGFAPIPAGLAHSSRDLDEPTDPRMVPSLVPRPPMSPGPQPGVRFRAGMFMPEQRTFFWEAATLLCNLLPLAAVALWMDEVLEVRPILAYSRQPLSPDLKQQVLAHVTYHLPNVVERDLRILTRVEFLEKEPLVGIFQTYLPVMLMGEGDGQDMMLLFRAEDRPFSEREQSYIQMVARMVGFHLQEVRLHERYHRAFLSVSHRLLSSVEGGAPKLRDHSLATAKLARSFALHMELSATDLEAVCIASILHDVGTFLLDPKLLSKPGLTPEEMGRIQTHPVLASTFLKDFRFPFDVLGIIRHHHERWDGKGYPDGLRGESIPLGSRIINLVEAFEVMNDGSAFKGPRTHREILDELHRGSGSQFDPTLVAEFLEFLQTRRR